MSDTSKRPDVDAITEAARLLEAFTSTAGVPYLEMEGHESTCRYCHRAWRGMAETHADECPVAQARAWLAQYG